MFAATCPHCRREVELDDDRRGRPVRCPLCQAAFRAPEAEDETASDHPGGGRWPDALAIAGACVAIVGLLATLAAIALRSAGETLPVGRDWIRLAVVVPIGIVALSWLVARKVEGPLFVLVARFAAYLWILCLLILVLKMLRD